MLSGCRRNGCKRQRGARRCKPESASWQTSRAVAEQSACAFDPAARAGEHVGRLPLKRSTMPDTVGAPYAAPVSGPVAAALDARKAVTHTQPGTDD